MTFYGGQKLRYPTTHLTNSDFSICIWSQLTTGTSNDQLLWVLGDADPFTGGAQTTVSLMKRCGTSNCLGVNAAGVTGQTTDLPTM